LAEEGPGRNHNWPVDLKTVGWLIGKAHYHLEGVGGLRLPLKVGA